jgi:5-methylcytosine-specific restriction endonuclease McrA
MTGWTWPPGWKKIRRAVFATKGHTCWWCGQPATQVDHVIPAALGGTHTLDNLVPACAPCNIRRGASLGGRIRAGTLVDKPWPSARQW